MKKNNVNGSAKIRPMKHFFGILATFVAWVSVCLVIFLADVIQQTNHYKNYLFFILIMSMIFIVFAMFYIFIVFTRPKIVMNTKYIVLINVMFVVCVALNYFFSRILNEYVRPFAIIALLTTILLGKRVGILSNICFAMIMFFSDIFCNQGTSFTVSLFAPVTINIFIGTLFVFLTNKDAKRMRGLLVSTYLIPPVVLISFIMEMMSVGVVSEVVSIIFWSALSPVLSAILFMAILPIIEYTFNVTTNFRLIELVDHNNELLKQMQQIAPGTYNHCYMVSNLAESCAYAIGENTHLVRAAAYYHDIGKMMNPEYFTENQVGVNPHDKLLPEISVSFLKKHVTYGVKMAKKYKLPEEIVNVIAEHHGTMLIKFFYYKALNYTDGDLPTTDFTYDGPKPQSKTSAIIMIVDACEAALRSVDKKDIEKVKKIVNSVVQERLDFNQFDECDITIKELNLIKQTIIDSVVGLYHERIGYPDIKITREGILADKGE